MTATRIVKPTNVINVKAIGFLHFLFHIFSASCFDAKHNVCSHTLIAWPDAIFQAIILSPPYALYYSTVCGRYNADPCAKVARFCPKSMIAFAAFPRALMQSKIYQFILRFAQFLCAIFLYLSNVCINSKRYFAFIFLFSAQIQHFFSVVTQAALYFIHSFCTQAVLYFIHFFCAQMEVYMLYIYAQKDRGRLCLLRPWDRTVPIRKRDR